MARRQLGYAPGVIYHREQLGPALKALRESRDLKQADVARALGRSEPNVSRLERSGANPQAASLMAYLEAVGANLVDLHHQLAERDDPVDAALEQQIAKGRARIRAEPSYRRLAKDLLERFGGPDLPPGMRAMADLIDQQDTRIDGQEARIRDLERRLPPGGEQGSSNGTDGGPVEG